MRPEATIGFAATAVFADFTTLDQHPVDVRPANTCVR